MADEQHGTRPGAHTGAHTDLASRLEDLLHVSVGLGILAFQKAQVHRQDLQKALSRYFS